MPSLNELMAMAFGQGSAGPQGAAPGAGPAQALGPAALGNGMAAQAAQVMQSRPYQMHVQEAKAMGEPPMSPEEFALKMQQIQPGVPQQPQ
jgi:hypothetical protein